MKKKTNIASPITAQVIIFLPLSIFSWFPAAVIYIIPPYTISTVKIIPINVSRTFTKAIAVSSISLCAPMPALSSSVAMFSLFFSNTVVCAETVDCVINVVNITTSILRMIGLIYIRYAVVADRILNTINSVIANDVIIIASPIIESRSSVRAFVTCS